MRRNGKFVARLQLPTSKRDSQGRIIRREKTKSFKSKTAAEHRPTQGFLLPRPPTGSASPRAFNVFNGDQVFIHPLIHHCLRHYATQSFLKWFIDEQVEEESTMHDMIGLLEHAGDDRSALLVLNEQVGKRPAEEA